jgi:hypothetical protein
MRREVSSQAFDPLCGLTGYREPFAHFRCGQLQRALEIPATESIDDRPNVRIVDPMPLRAAAPNRTHMSLWNVSSAL